MDIRDMSAGTELYLPVEVAGGLFSVGDTHATQGDGEVCGTAIESPCSLAAKFELVKNANLAFPRFTTPGPVARHMDVKGYEVTTGIGPDLMAGGEGRRLRHDRSPVQALQDECGRGLYAVQRVRRSQDQRDRRHAELGGLLLFPACRLRMSEAPLLSVEGLNVGFNTEQGPVRVVEDVSFELAAGETLGLVGESGCGKSVTAQTIMRLLPCPPSRIEGGRIMFEGEDLVALPERRMRKIRGDRIGMIFQEPMTSLNPTQTHRAADRRSSLASSWHGLRRSEAAGHRYAAQGRHRQCRTAARTVSA